MMVLRDRLHSKPPNASLRRGPVLGVSSASERGFVYSLQWLVYTTEMQPLAKRGFKISDLLMTRS